MLKPYGRALVELARDHPEILCLSGDLTRQCEVDLFQEAYPERFIHGGMAEANLVGLAGGLARRGFVPYVHTFGVFATRRAYDQVAMAVAYPNLPVRLVGFMPGISSPGGPSHQAIDDVALMRALPNMTVIDVADATEIAQVVPETLELPGPVYLRLKRGDIPVVRDADGSTTFRAVDRLRRSDEDVEVAIVASGMMLATALEAYEMLEQAGVRVGVVNVSVLKPFDDVAVLATVSRAEVAITIENHSIIGGLGCAVAGAMAAAGSPCRHVRMGVADRWAEGARTAAYLFDTNGLSVDDLVGTVWNVLGRDGPTPRTTTGEVAEEG